MMFSWSLEAATSQLVDLVYRLKTKELRRKCKENH